ncbi:GABA transporter 1-like [Zingiber officinale]|uniref:GABA transporter 1-like n=1 Tax=Zingiber officinale TaxID=94328 RepID=UPI001C4DBF61|nr:GABA transporter 1-like [Zingiber officinale]
MSISRVDGEELESAAQEGGGGGSGKGTWKHAAFHVATTIATPAAYAPLPFALASLGWPLGVGSLVLGTLTTWYSSLLVASLWQWDGKKHSTYRLLGKSIYGSWGYWFITMFQQIASLGNNIAIQIAAGSSLKAIYKYYDSDGSLTLQDFIIFFGALELLLSQLPDIHSLRWVNALCTFSTIGFAATTIGVTIYNGKNIDRDSISYGFHGSTSAKIFRAFNALGAIAFSFGDAMLPEIQSTVIEPAKKNMYKGVSAAYSIIILSYWQLAVSGYWAFGSQVQPYILSSLATPQWTIVMANIFAVIQISGCFQIYCRPTYANFENQVLSKASNGKAWIRKSLLRLCFTSIYMALITLVAAAMPFFGDFVSICGAVGFTPLDFVFPALAFLKAGKMPKNPKLRCLVQGIHLTIAAWFSVVAVLGCIGAVRFIVIDINTYKFFHDM